MLLRMIGQIKVSSDQFRCVFGVFLYVAKVFSESVAVTCPCIVQVIDVSHIVQLIDTLISISLTTNY